MSDDPEIISDEEIRDYLVSQRLDPVTAPYFCALQVAGHWNLPIAEACQLIDNL